MAKIKLTKFAVDELRDTLVPGFLCKITPAGRTVFMLQYRTNAGERRKPALGQYGELTVEQARSLAQVRRGGDPAADKAPTVKELCAKFMDYSRQRNKPSTQKGYQSVIDRNIIPMIGRLKVRDVKRPEIAGMMEKMAHKPADANRTFGVMRRMFNLTEVWGYRPDGTNPCRHVPMYPNGKATGLGERRGQRLILARNLLETLCGREVAAAAQTIATDTSLEHRPVGDSQRVSGVGERGVG